MGFFLFFFACLHLLLSFVIVLPFYLELLMYDYFLHRSHTYQWGSFDASFSFLKVNLITSKLKKT